MLMSSAGFLFNFSRGNMSYAGEFIKEEYAFSNLEIGYIGSAFLLGYSVLQIPGGILGQKLGSRKMMAGMLVAWVILNILTGMLPGLFTSAASGILAVLIGAQFLMGIGMAPFYGVAQGIVERWFPSSKLGTAIGVDSFIIYYGYAAVGPISVFLISNYGWRASFYASGPVMLGLAALSWWYGRNRPEEHPSINQAEIDLISVKDTVERTDTAEMHWFDVLKQKPILFLTLSYFCQGYVTYFFYNWLFIYLIEVKGFDTLEGGMASALPWIVGSFASLGGGFLCDYLVNKYNPGKSLRYICVGAMFLVAAFMFGSSMVDDKYSALFLLCICYAFVQLSEIVYWQSNALIAAEQTTIAGSVMNTGSNIMGFVAVMILGFFMDSYPNMVVLSCSLFAVLAAFFWFFVDANKQIGTVKK